MPPRKTAAHRGVGNANRDVFSGQMMCRAEAGVNVRKWEAEEKSRAGLYKKAKRELGKRIPIVATGR